MLCFINDKLIDEDQAMISINDRGFMFGDGIFETCHISNSKILDFTSHLKRLDKGLKSLEIKAKTSNLLEKSTKLIKENNIKDGILRLSISRGIGSNGFLPCQDIKPNIIIQTKYFKDLINKNITLAISKKITLFSKSILNKHKTANSLNYILAKIDSHKNGFFDNILLNENNEICETSSANIFIVKNNLILTPSLECGLLSGTKRQKIIDICQQNVDLKIKETKITINDLKNCDEVFISNSSFLILAVNAIKIDNNLIKFTEDKISKNLRNRLLIKLQNEL